MKTLKVLLKVVAIVVFCLCGLNFPVSFPA